MVERSGRRFVTQRAAHGRRNDLAAIRRHHPRAVRRVDDAAGQRQVTDGVSKASVFETKTSGGCVPRQLALHSEVFVLCVSDAVIPARYPTAGRAWSLDLVMGSAEPELGHDACLVGATPPFGHLAVGELADLHTTHSDRLAGGVMPWNGPWWVPVNV